MGGRLAIVGAGGMGRELVRAARAVPEEIVLVSDAPADGADYIVIGFDGLRADDRICVAVGSPRLRRQLAERCAGFAFASVMAPTALLDPTARVGEGLMLCDVAMINSRAVIGRHFLCNYYSHVSHDCVIGDFVTFSPRVSCCGTVHIGDDVFIGAGAVIRNGTPDRPLRIGAGAVIGMGAVVVEDVPEGAKVLGVPARS
jgi:sugar O-acyltransferase (sialic acid O-acetyltransferase NeuD family)